MPSLCNLAGRFVFMNGILVSSSFATYHFTSKWLKYFGCGDHKNVSGFITVVTFYPLIYVGNLAALNAVLHAVFD